MTTILLEDPPGAQVAGALMPGLAPAQSEAGRSDRIQAHARMLYLFRHAIALGHVHPLLHLIPMYRAAAEAAS